MSAVCNADYFSFKLVFFVDVTNILPRLGGMMVYDQQRFLLNRYIHVAIRICVIYN